LLRRGNRGNIKRKDPALANREGEKGPKNFLVVEKAKYTRFQRGKILLRRTPQSRTVYLRN